MPKKHQPTTHSAFLLIMLAAAAALIFVSTPDAYASGPSLGAINAGFYHTCARLTDGTMKCWGYNILGQLGDGTTLTRLTPTSVTW